MRKDKKRELRKLFLTGKRVPRGYYTYPNIEEIEEEAKNKKLFRIEQVDNYYIVCSKIDTYREKLKIKGKLGKEVTFNELSSIYKDYELSSLRKVVEKHKKRLFKERTQVNEEVKELCEKCYDISKLYHKVYVYRNRNKLKAYLKDTEFVNSGELLSSKKDLFKTEGYKY